ncbi:Ig-like domain-containing protein [Bacillus sp. AFS002410]|uniref:Ig-like domain-containing protein n=1 Tax=Bacillus sp. AFS002410 TaxID=2033481 RepID=UPI001155D714|nr:Ig-like domain-containing protein [Bacillus sp. AFS002410]
MLKWERQKIHYYMCVVLVALFSFVLFNRGTQVHAETGTIVKTSTITENTTWDLKGSPYFINGKVQIKSPAVLTIEPGVQIIGVGIEPNVLDVNQNLAGEVQKPIYMKNINLVVGFWDVTVDHVVFNQVQFYKENGSLTLTNNVISQSEFHLNFLNKSSFIENNVIKNNSTLYFNYGYQMNIMNNSFFNNLNRAALNNYDPQQNQNSQINGNNFLDTGKEVYHLFYMYPAFHIQAEKNFYGTSDRNVINRMFYTNRQNYDGSLNFDYDQFLTQYNEDAPFIIVPKKVTDASKFFEGKIVGNLKHSYSISIKSPKGVFTGETTSNGEFKLPISSQIAGTEVAIQAADSVTGQYDYDWEIVKDETPPATPIPNLVTDKSKIVSGKSEIGSNVTVKINSIMYKGVTNTNGLFNISIPIQKGGTSITIFSTDASGNKSIEKKLTVKDVTPPNAPKVGLITSKSKIVSVKTEPYAIVTIQYNRSVFKLKADKNGVFKKTVKPQKIGTSFTFTSSDLSGNRSQKTSVKIKK